MIIYGDFVPKMVSWFIEVGAITLYPFIFARKHYENDSDKTMLRHESIHLAQQKETLVIGFYLIYILHWLYNLIKYGNTYDAYMNIVFEKEAYDNEDNHFYLANRKFWAWARKG
jgi:hypothetical protein